MSKNEQLIIKKMNEIVLIAKEINDDWLAGLIESIPVVFLQNREALKPKSHLTLIKGGLS